MVLRLSASGQIFAEAVPSISGELLICGYATAMLFAQALQLIHPWTALKVGACADVCIGRNDIIGQAEIARGQFEVIFSGEPSNEPIASAPNDPYRVSVVGSLGQANYASVSVLTWSLLTQV